MTTCLHTGDVLSDVRPTLPATRDHEDVENHAVKFQPNVCGFPCRTALRPQLSFFPSAIWPSPHTITASPQDSIRSGSVPSMEAYHDLERSRNKAHKRCGISFLPCEPRPLRLDCNRRSPEVI